MSVEVEKGDAYHLEGQAIAVHNAQLASKLTESSFTFHRLDTREDMGHTWYIINHSMILFSLDCNPEVISKLSNLETLREIQTPYYYLKYLMVELGMQLQRSFLKKVLYINPQDLTWKHMN